MGNKKKNTFVEGLARLFEDAGVDTPEARLKMLSEAIPQVVSGFRRSWSNVDADIDSVMKSEVGVAVLMTYVENGERHVLLCQSGAHYFKSGEGFSEDTFPERYSYPGGFANLVEREGSFFVKTQKGAESPEEAGAREVEEEIVDDQGRPVIFVDPVRLKPLDHDIVINKYGKPIVVCSMYYDLALNEVSKLKNHIAKLEESDVYRQACAEHTKSPASGLPEVHTTRFATIHETATIIPFLHPGMEVNAHRLLRHEADVLLRASAEDLRAG